MTYLLEGENIVEERICAISGEKFFVTDKDLAFYDQVSPVIGGKKYDVPAPTLCPLERQRRRLMFRNERKLYHRKCEVTGRQVISNYSADKPCPIFHKDYWMSDDHNPLEYGIDLNFDEPFFKQMKKLSDIAPRLHAQQWAPLENCDYTNYVSNCENCYLLFDSDFNQDCLYCNVSGYLKDCVDCSITIDSRNCFETYNCSDCHYLRFGSNCVNCRESWFLDNCIGCQNCALSVNLRNKEYCFENKQLTKEEYEEKLAKLLLDSNIRKYRGNFSKYAESFPRKCYQGTQGENISGDRIVNAKNVKHSFGIYECEDVAYCDLLANCKNCMDVSSFGSGISWVYDSSTIGLDSQNCLFGNTNIQSCSNLMYCYIAYRPQDCFGCIGIKRAKNSILNTAYSQAEYEELVGKMIDHMRETGEWGEHFEHELSPFGYNETVAAEYLPLTRDEVLEKGWKWKDDDESASYHGEYYSPLALDQYNEKVVGIDTARANVEECLKGIVKCEVTGKPFKIIKQELVFCVENGIPLPSKSPDQRHSERMSIGNPRKLHDRTCDKCSVEISTSYDPTRPEKVYCEECYRKEVY